MSLFPSHRRRPRSPSLNVARIPYLNAQPFSYGWGDEPPFEVVDMMPRALGRAAAEGSVDAGLMAVADYFGLDGTFELTVPPMGIAVRDHVRSVVLLARRRPRHLDGRRIGITGESSTSRRLLELLARARWEVAPEWVPEDELGADPRESVDGLLLIGDRALEAMADQRRHGWERVVDLATAWWEWQRQPFVFAVWAMRTTLPRRERERLSGFLTGSLAVGSEHLGEIAAAAASERLGTRDDLAAYLRNFVYRLSQAERKGLQRFRDLLAEHDILEYQQTPV
ncbi:MAG TPA: menaquinone biosynthesis protein [Gemmatimonadota bacterium]|nr:menaquinone biosynthesis protein [Gemmatimonadota bacterium]